MTRLVARGLLLIAAAAIAFAGGETVPEIDPTFGVAAVTLVSGALLVLRGRRKR